MVQPAEGFGVLIFEPRATVLDPMGSSYFAAKDSVVVGKRKCLLDGIRMIDISRSRVLTSCKQRPFNCESEH